MSEEREILDHAVAPDRAWHHAIQHEAEHRAQVARLRDTCPRS